MHPDSATASRATLPAWAAHGLVFLLFLLLALLITFPLVLHLGDQAAGYPDSDAYEMLRNVWWFKTALQSGQEPFFQPLLGYPDGIEGITLWANPLQFFPMWLFAFFLPLAAAYNLTIVLTMALNGWALYGLLWALLDGRHNPQVRPAAILGGAVFLAHPVMQGHLAGGHAGLLVMWGAPLLVWALWRLTGHADTAEDTQAGNRGTWIAGLRPRWLALAALFFVLTPGGHALQAIYVLLPIGMWFALRALWQRDWGGLLRLALAGALGSVLLGLFLLPSIRATVATAAYEEQTNVRYSADLLAVVTPSFNHPLYGQLEFTHRVLGVNIVEGAAYVGLVAGLLALVALLRVRAARGWLLLAGIAWVLSLGPVLKVFDAPLVVQTDEYSSYVTLPYALVQDLPLFTQARTPGRFNFTLALALAVLAGYGAAWLLGGMRGASGRRAQYTAPLQGTSAAAWRDAGRRFALTAVLLALLLFDYQSFFPLPTVPAEPPAVFAMLGQEPGVRAVFNLPWDNVLAAKEALWLQTVHGLPLIAGQVTRQTPVSPAKLSLLQQTLDAALLDAAGADIIILHRHYDPDGSLYAHTRARLGAPFYEDERFALFRRPDAGMPPRELVTRLPAETNITSRADAYLYAPVSGWALFSAALAADGRDTVFTLDGWQVRALRVAGETQVRLPLPVETAGYHTLTLALEPPCPLPPTPTLRCRGLLLQDARLDGFLPSAFAPVRFARGVTLRGGVLAAQAGAQVTVYLAWDFAESVRDSDIRFVHILAPTGDVVAQEDIPPGAFAAGVGLVEVVQITLPDALPPGEYRVVTGWYTYPEIVRFAVLDDVPGAAEGFVLVGAFALPGE